MSNLLTFILIYFSKTTVFKVIWVIGNKFLGDGIRSY